MLTRKRRKSLFLYVTVEFQWLLILMVSTLLGRYILLNEPSKCGMFLECPWTLPRMALGQKENFCPVSTQLTKWLKKRYLKMVEMFRICLATNLILRSPHLLIVAVKFFTWPWLHQQMRETVEIRITSNWGMPAALPLWSVFLGIPEGSLGDKFEWGCGIL